MQTVQYEFVPVLLNESFMVDTFSLPFALLLQKVADHGTRIVVQNIIKVTQDCAQSCHHDKKLRERLRAKQQL